MDINCIIAAKKFGKGGGSVELPDNVLTDDKLATAIDTALAQAKASGEFDGSDGAAGKTPVKGTDYYTAADKTEMVNLVLAALPTWTGGSY